MTALDTHAHVRAQSDGDAVIVGFGPVGALTALLLAEEGLSVIVCEKSNELVQLPRAVGLDGESVRAFQRIGRAGPVSALLQAPRKPDECAFTDSRRNTLLCLEIAERGPNGWQDIAFFDQPELEAFLRQEVEAHPRIDVRLGHEVVSVDSNAEEARLETRDVASGETALLRTPWLIGCDGASSFVRRQAGIEWNSLGYDQDWLVIDIIAHDLDLLPGRMMQVCDPERLTTYICVKDPNRRWEFQLLPGESREEMVAPDRIEALLDAWLPRDSYELRRAAVYQFHAATASAWRRDRILLAGDAAHQTPPFLGQGLNAGFRDAVNLGWKIPLVVRGEFGPELIDSYGAERDAHARDLVERAVAIGKLMETLAAREAGRPDPHPAPSEPPSPGIPPLRSGLLVHPQCGPGSSVGHLLRQPTVRSPGRDAALFDEWLGSGFAIVGRTAADCELGPRARAIFEAWGGRACSIEGLEAEQGEFDRLFEAHPAALIRPDRVVHGVVDDDHTLDVLVEMLARDGGMIRHDA
jgi:3-(3-hydroxy-phenyl)propionate hydroxylase